MAGTRPSVCVRSRARVQGTVQGVGFRPFVYRLAHEHGLVGYVLNDQQGVLLEVEGEAQAVDRFLSRLEHDAPPLAKIEAIVAERVPTTGEAGFRIVESAAAGTPDAPVTPDAATCEACLAELLDPADRRIMGVIFAAAFVFAVAVIFAYFYPIYVGQTITYDQWLAHMWLGNRWI
jgi:hydrogenase maturation protein HypF